VLIFYIYNFVALVGNNFVILHKVSVLEKDDIRNCAHSLGGNAWSGVFSNVEKQMEKFTTR
jgi:hypothetical protein